MLFAVVRRTRSAQSVSLRRCKAMSGVGGKADLPVEHPDFSV